MAGTDLSGPLPKQMAGRVLTGVRPHGASTLRYYFLHPLAPFSPSLSRNVMFNI